MTASTGLGLFALGMILTVTCFYIALAILPKYFDNEDKEEPKKHWWQ